MKTLRNENGKLREFDLYPNEPKFYETLHKNLLECCSEFYGALPEEKEVGASFTF
jgi:CRISPR-associated endoribonuclease Cas6